MRAIRLNQNISFMRLKDVWICSVSVDSLISVPDAPLSSCCTQLALTLQMLLRLNKWTCLTVEFFFTARGKIKAFILILQHKLCLQQLFPHHKSWLSNNMRHEAPLVLLFPSQLNCIDRLWSAFEKKQKNKNKDCMLISSLQMQSITIQTDTWTGTKSICSWVSLCSTSLTGSRSRRWRREEERKWNQSIRKGPQTMMHRCQSEPIRHKCVVLFCPWNTGSDL